MRNVRQQRVKIISTDPAAENNNKNNQVQLVIYSSKRDV